MLDVLKTLSATSVPNILMGLGAVLILLAFVEKIGSHIELPARRQKTAAIVGVLLLTLGIAVTAIPHLPIASASDTEQNGQRLTEIPGPANGKNDARERPDIARNNGTTEADTRDRGLYSGPLGTVLPSPALLPDSSQPAVSHTLTSADRVEDFPDHFAEVQHILDADDYQSLLVTQDLDEWACDRSVGYRMKKGRVSRVRFRIEKFSNAQTAKEWHEFLQSQLQDNPQPELRSFETGIGEEKSTLAQYVGKCATLSALIVGRSVQASNLVLSAVTFSSPKDLDDPKVLMESRKLLDSMISKARNALK